MSIASPPSPSTTRPTTPTDNAAVAAGVLADTAVRSVTIESGSDVATVLYHDRRVTRATLSGLATFVRANSLALAQTNPQAPAEIECWSDPVSGRDCYVRSAKQATGWRRVMHLTLAGIWFTLAVLGAILPGLPCTCFLLLTSYSLCRSSTRLHNRLLDSRWFGPTLRHWRVHRGVRPGVKTKALSMLTLMVGCSLAFAPLPPVAWWAVAGAGAIGASCILRLRVIEQ